MKQLLIVLLGTCGCVCVLHGQAANDGTAPATLRPYEQASGGAISSRTARLPAASFRIIFGVHDAKPTAWDGEVLAQPGQTVEIEADRFRAHQYENKSWSKGIISIALPDPTLPNDALRGGTAWVASTRYSPLHGPTTEWHDYGLINEIKGHPPLQQVLVQPSVVVRLMCDCLDAPVRIRTAQGEFSFVPREIVRQHVGYFLSGNIEVDSVAPEQAVAPKRLGQQDFPSVLSSSSGTLWTAWQEYDGAADELVVRSRTAAGWGAVTVLARNADIFHTALAEDARHRIWLVWSMQINGRWDLYARVCDGGEWSAPQRLTFGEATRNIYHAMTTDSSGRMWLVWQRTGAGFSGIYAKSFAAGSGPRRSRSAQGPPLPETTGGPRWPPGLMARLPLPGMDMPPAATTSTCAAARAEPGARKKPWRIRRSSKRIRLSRSTPAAEPGSPGTSPARTGARPSDSSPERRERRCTIPARSD